MIACDRCLERKCSTVSIIFRKKDFTKSKNSKPRHMIEAEFELCEQCITEFLKAFGRFKVAFMKEGDQEQSTQVTHED
jgi:hypothetical protein